MLKKYFENIEIYPKYIYVSNGGDKKTIYQKNPTEIMIDKNLYIKSYVQDTINNFCNEQNYDKIVLVDDNDNECLINTQYFLKNIMVNIKNSRNRKYNLIKIKGKIICINMHYEYENKKCNSKIINEKIMALLFGSIALGNIFLYKILNK
jgi:hypothetical protein